MNLPGKVCDGTRDGLAVLKVALAGVPADGYSVSAVVPVRMIQPVDAGPLPVESVHLEGVLRPVDGNYLFQGKLHAVFSHSCDRCLGPVETPVDIELLWPFAEGPPQAWDADDSGETFTYQGLEINLGPCVWEELALAAPVKYICKEDCAGLCPRCGADRNAGACGCPDDAEEMPRTHRGFADLAKRFPDLASADPESEE